MLWHPVPLLYGKQKGNNGNSDTLFSWAPKSLWMMTAAMKLKTLAPWKKSYNQPRQCIQQQRNYFETKVHIFKTMVFPVVMYECESWTIRRLTAEELMLWDCGVGEDS